MLQSAFLPVGVTRSNTPDHFSDSPESWLENTDSNHANANNFSLYLDLFLTCFSLVILRLVISRCLPVLRPHLATARLAGAPLWRLAAPQQQTELFHLDVSAMLWEGGGGAVVQHTPATDGIASNTQTSGSPPSP